MNRSQRIALLVLVLAWGGVAIVMQQTDDLVATPQEVLALMEEAPWLEQPGLNEDRRAAHLDELLQQYDLLKLPDRSRLRDDEPEIVERFVQSLTETEINRYLDHTLAPALRVVTEALEKMKPEDRKFLMSRFRRDLGTDGLSGAAAPDVAASNEQRPAEEKREGLLDGLTPVELETLILTAPTEEKLRLAPMLEAFQARIQGLRR